VRSLVMDFPRLFAWVFAPVAAHRRAWVALNLLYFGVIILGSGYTLADPTIQPNLVRQVGASFSSQGSLGGIAEAYIQGNLAQAVAFTWLLNLFGGSLLALTAISLAFPFLGIGIGLLRAFLWGVLFSPLGGVVSPEVMLASAPHLGVVALEGEGYVVAMLGVWIWWYPVITGNVAGTGGRLRAWWSGLLYQGRIYVAVATILALAAIYEALELIYVVPRLLPTAP
jgi:hypothetical protein